MMVSLYGRTNSGRPRPAHIVVSVVLLSFCAADCSARSADAGLQPSQSAQQGWRLTFQMSGGFAGFDRQLELASDGTAVATDNRRKRQVSRMITRDELQEIDRLAASAVSMDLPGRTQCADCLAYSIDLRIAGKQVVIRVRDDSLADSQVGPLIQALSRLQNRLLAGP